jgi:hypothetical protein
MTYTCQPLPGGCASDRSCGCVGATLCTGTFDHCSNNPAPNTITCECLACQ